MQPLTCRGSAGLTVTLLTRDLHFLMSGLLCCRGFWGVGSVLTVVVFIHGLSPGVAVEYIPVWRFL